MAQRLVLITPVQFAATPKAPTAGAPGGQPGAPPTDPAAGAPTLPAPFLAQVTFLEGGASVPDLPSGPVDPGYGINLPVDPGYGKPVFPPHIGNWVPGQGFPHPSHPIYHPDKPTPPGGGGEEPPPTIWPPLEPERPEGPGKPPGEGIMPGYILVWVPGVGYRWVRVGDKPEGPKPPTGKPPETAQPKR